MTKEELVTKLAQKAGVSKKGAKGVLEAFIGVVSGELASGGSVGLVGFGTFKTAKRAARKGRNPQTGKEIKIAARTVPKFVAGKALKEAATGKKGKKK